MATTIRRIRKSVYKIAERAGLPDAQAQVAADVVQGICQTSSCHLSEIGRALHDDVPIMETEQRLSETLARPSFASTAVAEAYLHVVAAAARRMPFIALDPTELVKRYGRAFEYLDTVRDASDRRKPLEPGYWTVCIEATDDENNVLPLYTQAFSTKTEDYAGWNATFSTAMQRIIRTVGNDHIWLFDRAFDGIDWMRECERLQVRWLIRQQQTRNIQVATGAIYDMHVFASALNRPHPTRIPYVDKSTHERRSFPVQYGYAPVRVPDLDADLYLIVVQRPERDALVLLTNERIRSPKQAARLVLAYMRRWGVEDGIRFWKQKTGIEDFRVRSWNSIQNLVVLSMIAGGLQALLLLTRPSLARRFIERVKTFIPVVPFQLYRLWGGVQSALLAGA